MPRRKTSEDIDASFDLQPSTSTIKKLKPDNERYMLLDETIVNVLLDTESDNSDFDFDISSTDMSEESEESDQESVLSRSASSTPEPGTSVTWNTTRPITSNVPFTGNPGLITSTSSDEPIDYFFLLANDKFFDLVLRETNIQGHKLRSGSPSKSRMKNFRDITREDLEVFLGLIFLAANVQAPSFAHYWTKNDLYVFPPFSNAMPRDKFQSILCSLHFCTSAETGASDPLNKVQPLLNYFNDTMREIYYPNKNLTLDECMLYSHPNVRSKSRKRVKFYMLTEPDGVVLRTLIDCDRDLDGHAERIVKTLLADFLQVGHSLFLYNFYTNVPLVRELLQYKTYCTGILRPNCKSPSDLVNKTIGRGEVDARYTPEGVCVLKWRDKRDALMISSEYKADIVKVQSKSGKHVQKPELVEKYNKYMNGTERADQFLGKHTRTKMTLLKFREAVIDKLIYKNRPRLDVIPKPAGQNVHLPRMSGHEGGKKIRKSALWALMVGQFCWTNLDQSCKTTIAMAAWLNNFALSGG
nr:PREDICTED: piggyBac transposable element-derived protein 4-like [Megachile rotundata]